MSRKLSSRLKSLTIRNNALSIRAVQAPITTLSTWIVIRPRGRVPYYYNIETRNVSYGEPVNAVIIDSYREHVRMVANDAASRARYLAREHLRTEIEVPSARVVQLIEHQARLATLKINTDNLRKIYDELYAKYSVVCKFYNLPIIEIEKYCENCLCTINDEVMMYPTAIRNQTKKAYEKHTITKWLTLGNTSDPSRIEKDPLTFDDLGPNIDIKVKIDKYKELMQQTIDANPLPSAAMVNGALANDAPASEALAAGPLRKKTNTKRRRKKKKKKA
jgi:hypothetical protein